MASKTIVRLITIFLAVVFLYAAIDQLKYYPVFRLQVQKFLLLLPYITKISWMIPASEFLIVILLLLPVTRVKGLFVSLFFLSICTIYLAGFLDDQYNQPCHCAEPVQYFSLKWHIIFNLVAILITCVGVALSGKIVAPMPAIVCTGSLPNSRSKDIVPPEIMEPLNTSGFYPN